MFFWRKRKCHWQREIRTASNKQNWRKHCKISSNFALKSSTDCQKHSRASEHRQTVRKILTEDLDMKKVCAKMVPKELTEEQKQRRVFSYWTNNCVGTHCLFTGSSIKEISKGRHFDDIDDIRSNTTEALKAIPQNQFQNCFEGWTRRWHRCIASQGEYFEGDHGGIQQWVM